MATFGEKIKQLRLENNLKIRDLSYAMDITETAWRNYEADKRQPNFDGIKFICRRFNVSSDYLLGLSDKRA